MSLSIVIPGNRKNYTVKSGKKLKLKALVGGWTDKKEKVLIWGDENGFIDESGLFIAPIVESDITYKVVVTCVEEPTSSEFLEILVKKVEPPSIDPSKSIKIFGGGEQKFALKSPFGEVKSKFWRIVDNARGKGRIEPSTGQYFAPVVVNSDCEVEIECIDQSSGKTIQVTVYLKATYFTKIVAIPEINAGEKEIQLPIEVSNDLHGGDNFTCELISGYGEIRSHGLYTPPETLSSKMRVEIEAISLLDDTKRQRISFFVLPQKCSVCKNTTDGSGFCKTCDEPISFGAIYAKNKMEGKS